jgi:hypothetical protein
MEYTKFYFTFKNKVSSCIFLIYIYHILEYSQILFSYLLRRNKYTQLYYIFTYCVASFPIISSQMDSRDEKWECKFCAYGENYKKKFNLLCGSTQECL